MKEEKDTKEKTVKVKTIDSNGDVVVLNIPYALFKGIMNDVFHHKSDKKK